MIPNPIVRNVSPAAPVPPAAAIPVPLSYGAQWCRQCQGRGNTETGPCGRCERTGIEPLAKQDRN